MRKIEQLYKYLWELKKENDKLKEEIKDIKQFINK